MVLFVLFSPIFLFLFIVLGIHHKSSPFFAQARPGKNGKIFYILKFKTMNDSSDEFGNLLPDDKRITSIGRWVRNSSMDEIPQLINVIKGDMSMIGPRPLLVEYLQLYTEEQNKRHKLRPGVTGWAQVNGRNAISWERKFEYDIEYVNNCSFLFDLKILFVTVFNVLNGKGITQKGHVSSGKFTGAVSEVTSLNDNTLK